MQNSKPWVTVRQQRALCGLGFGLAGVLILIIAMLLFSGCTPFISELSDSSGCLYSTGGPAPGMPSGVVLVCRSGKDKAKVTYSDKDGRQITIEHRE